MIYKLDAMWYANSDGNELAELEGNGAKLRLIFTTCLWVVQVYK